MTHALPSTVCVKFMQCSTQRAWVEAHVNTPATEKGRGHERPTEMKPSLDCGVSIDSRSSHKGYYVTLRMFTGPNILPAMQGRWPYSNYDVAMSCTALGRKTFAIEGLAERSDCTTCVSIALWTVSLPPAYPSTSGSR